MEYNRNGYNLEFDVYETYYMASKAVKILKESFKTTYIEDTIWEYKLIIVKLNIEIENMKYEAYKIVKIPIKIIKSGA